MQKNPLRNKLMNENEYNPFHKEYDYLNIFKITEKMENISEDDIKIEDLSILINSYFFNKYYKKTYENLDFYLENTELSVRKLIECFMSIPNLNCFFTEQKLINKFVKDKDVNTGVINSYNMEGFEIINARSVCEAGVSVTNIILNHIKHCQEKIKENKREGMKEIDNKEILSVYKHTKLRYILKNSYDDVVWNQGEIILKDKNMYLKFQDKDMMKINCVGDWRSDKLVSEHISIYHNGFEKYPKFKKKLLYSKRKNFIYEVKEENGYIKCCLDENIKYINEDSFKLIHMAQVKLFYPYIVNIKFEKLNGLILDEIIDLYSILNEIIIKSEKNKTINDDINSFGYKIKKNDLVKYLESATIFSKEQVHSFVGLVSFDFETDEKRLDLYKKPIVLYKDVYYLNSLLIKSPNTLFMVDEWLKELGYDLKERGTDFEKYLKNRLTEVFEEKKIENQIINKAKFYMNKEKYEEIDLIIELEKIIIVGEVKCIKYPMEPRDFHNTHKILYKASSQIRRKVEFLKKNQKIFKNEIRGLGDKEIVKIVITNYPLFTGYSINDVPIVDNFTFEQYFEIGEIKSIITKLENGFFKKYEINKKRFYNNKEELYSNMNSYFKVPLIVSEKLNDIKIENILILKDSDEINLYKECAVME